MHVHDMAGKSRRTLSLSPELLTGGMLVGFKGLVGAGRAQPMRLRPPWDTR